MYLFKAKIICFAVVFSLLTGIGYGQTVLLSNPGKTYNDTDGPTFDVYGPVDISNCSSVRFELDFSFSLPWEGSGNMESSDECAFATPPCAGIPSMPLGPCANCWDFLWAQFIIDGAEIGGDLIGEAGTTNAEQDGSITLDWCTSGRAATAQINITTQTWAANESVTFSSLMIICYEGLPTADANPNPICDEEELNLIGRLDDPGVVDDHEWSGPGTIDDPFSLNTTVSDLIPGSATYTLTTTDENGCTASDDIMVIVHPTPDAFPAGPLTLCTTGGGQADFDLTTLNLTISGGSGDPVRWFRDVGLTSSISNPTVFRSGSTTVFAVVDNGFCQSEVIEVELIVLQTPQAFPATVEKCEEVAGTGRATFDLSELDDIVSGGQAGVNVTYYSDPMGLVPVPNPFNTGTIILYARVNNGECESALVEVRLFVYPRPQGKSFTAKRCESPPGSGQALFNLDSIADSMKLIPSHAHEFYEDAFLSQEVNSPFWADEGVTILYLQLSDGRCESGPIQLTLEVVKAPQLSASDLAVCEDPPGSGEGLFELDSLTNLITGGQQDIDLEWFADSNGVQLFNSPYRGTDTTIYVRGYNGACYSDLLPVNLITIEPPTAQSFSDTACANAQGLALFNLNDYLHIIASDTNIQRVEFASDSLFDQFIPSGDLWTRDTLIYARVINGSCASDVATLRLTVLPGPDFMVPDTIKGCDSINLPSISGANLSASASYYSEPQGQGQSWNEGQTITQSGYIYLYDSNGECTDEDSLFVHITPSPNAGVDNRISVCSGSSVFLPDLLSQVSTGGRWVDDSLTGSFVQDTFYSNGFEGRTVSFTYILPGVRPCSPDSAVITIDVVDEVVAGLDTMLTLCLGDTILLPSLLRQADFGGSFVDASGSGGILADTFFTSFAGPGQHSITYTIGDGVVCPEQNASIMIIVEDGVDLFPLPDTSQCEFFVLPPLQGTNTQLASFYGLSGGQGTSYATGDTIRSTQTIYAFGTSGSCSDEISFDVTILEPQYFTLVSTLCADSSLTVGNRTFDQQNPKGEVILTGMASNGCDSIISVDLSYFQKAQFDLIDTLCDGESIVINGTTFNQNNPSGTETLKNGSFQGCDSTVNIKLSFYNTTLNLDTTLCEAGFITVNGQIYDMSRPSGMEVLPGAAQSGCDSTILVNLTFSEDVEFDLNQTLCFGEELLVNGTIYNAMNPIGVETFTGAASNGCDSIVRVNLSFTDIADTLITGQICQGDTLVIHGQSYYFEKPTGLDTLFGLSSRGCDSIIRVNLSPTAYGLELILDTLCPDDEVIIAGQVFNKNRPTGDITIPNGSKNGCDSTISINLTFEEFEVTPSFQEFDLALGESINISFTTDFPYEIITWNDSTGVACTNCLQTIITPTSSTTYVVTFQDKNGCSLTAEIVVRVRIIDDVYVPNVFTPNGDNINDRLSLFARNGVIREIKSFEIYSRWGELIYQEISTRLEDETHQGWDGTFNGEVLSPDVYVLHAVVQMTSGDMQNFSTSVTLLR